MKTLLFIFLFISSIVHAQFDIQDPNKYIDHAWGGMMIGFTVNTASYKVLSNTGLDLTACKIIAPALSKGAVIGLSHLKEKRDNHYNKKDILFAVIGETVGSFLGSLITWGDIPANKARRKIKQEKYEYNPPLVRKN